MIKVIYTSELSYATFCCGCSKETDDKSICIMAKSQVQNKWNVLYLCDKCRRELYEKI